MNKNEFGWKQSIFFKLSRMYSFAFRKTESEDKHYTVKYSKENQERLFHKFRLFSKDEPSALIYHEMKGLLGTNHVSVHKVNFRNKKITVVGRDEVYELVLINY